MAVLGRIDSILDKLDSLIEVQELYETILNSLPFGILVVNKNFIIEKVNETFCQYTGYDDVDVKGHPITTIMPKEDRSMHAKHEADFRKNPRLRLGNHGVKPYVLAKDGSKKLVDITLVPIIFQGEGKVVVLIRDYQELKESINP